MIQHVIFDLGNVLIHIHPDRAMAEFARLCNQPFEAVRALFLSPLHNQIMSGEISPTRFYQQVLYQLRCQMNQARFRQVWLLVLGPPKEGVGEIVETLAEQGVGLSICSNTDPWHWQAARQSAKFFDRFQYFFLSYEMKLLKPDLRVFTHMAERLPVPPNACLFLDDTEENVLAARKVGYAAEQVWDAPTIRAALKKHGLPRPDPPRTS